MHNMPHFLTHSYILMFELHVHTYLIKQVHLESYLGGRWRWRRILIFLIVYTFVNNTSPVFLKYPLLKWQTLSNMMSAANNSPNEVLGNERNQMISQLNPDWSLSCQPPRVQFKFLLQTHNSSKDNIFHPRNWRNQLDFEDFFRLYILPSGEKGNINWLCFKSEHSGGFSFKYHLLSKGKKKMEWKSNTILLL